ncbi:MAG: TerB family tellurite resistance protein [Gammaproteobacteria bacterium]|nr:TerB family tellurite resistance protein [Gammaproteobacteria bacterium]
MLGTIKKFFEDHIQVFAEEANLQQQHRMNVAAVALLLETARADFNVRDEELQTVARHVQEFLGLNESETAELVSLAETEAKNATCYYEFTSLINKGFSTEDKIKIIELMWQIAYSDTVLEKYEEALVRKIADLLYVPHSAFIAAKHRAQSGSGKCR